jgi:hypothetical protein
VIAVYQISAIILAASALTYVSYNLVVSAFQIKYFGLWFWLLAVIATGFIADIITTSLVLSCTLQLLEQDEDWTQHYYNVCVRGIYASDLISSVTFLCTYTAHWVFSIRYWVLSCKLKLIKEKKQPS